MTSERPTNVDTASALALLQEEELNQSKSRPYNKEFSQSYSKESTSEQKKRIRFRQEQVAVDDS